LKEKAAAEIQLKRQSKLQAAVDARLLAMKTTGSRVSVRIPVDGAKYGQWWAGEVIGYRRVPVSAGNDGVGVESSSSSSAPPRMLDEIQVRFAVTSLAVRRGMTTPVEKWVPLDTEVRLMS